MEIVDGQKKVFDKNRETCLHFHFALCTIVRIAMRLTVRKSFRNYSIQALFGLKKWSLITQFSSPITQHSVFITQHSALSFHHSSFITYHSSLKTPHPVWHHHSLVITQYFSIICGPHTCTLCSFYFFFFFFLQPPVAKFTEPSEKKK